MLRPGKGPTGALPNYAAVSAVSVPSGGAYGVGYGYASDQSAYQNNNVNYGSERYSRHYDDDTFKDKPSRSRQPDIVNMLKKYAKEPMAWVSVTAVFFCLLTVHYRGQLSWVLRSFEASNIKGLFNKYNIVQDSLEKCRSEVQRTQASDYDRQNRISTLEREVRRLEGEKSSLEQKSKERVSTKHKEHIEALTARDFAWKEQVEILQNATQRESKRSATELFGPGPHHVKFTVILPSDEQEKEQHFIIEMAPLDLMPHTVYFFLQQVVHGLWNDAWFYLNGPHVLQAGPQASEDEEELWHIKHNDDDDRAVALQDFRDLSLETLAFPEYSEKYQHEKWTLGFTGRPGGPDFYINKLDNTKSHGPGGQYQHDLYEYGDPCFAKVVEGFDVLHSMFKEATFPDHSDWGWFFEDPIHIVSAKIMEDAPLKLEVAKESDNHSRKPEKPLKKHKVPSLVDP